MKNQIMLEAEQLLEEMTACYMIRRIPAPESMVSVLN